LTCNANASAPCPTQTLPVGDKVNESDRRVGVPELQDHIAPQGVARQDAPLGTLHGKGHADPQGEGVHPILLRLVIGLEEHLRVAVEAQRTQRIDRLVLWAARPDLAPPGFRRLAQHAAMDLAAQAGDGPGGEAFDKRLPADLLGLLEAGQAVMAGRQGVLLVDQPYPARCPRSTETAQRAPGLRQILAERLIGGSDGGLERPWLGHTHVAEAGDAQGLEVLGPQDRTGSAAPKGPRLGDDRGVAHPVLAGQPDRQGVQVIPAGRRLDRLLGLAGRFPGQLRAGHDPHPVGRDQDVD